jgi:hypothetical protein
VKWLLSALLCCGWVGSAAADGIVLMNNALSDMSNVKLEYQDQRGAHLIERFDKLASRSEKRMSMSRLRRPSGDWSYLLSFTVQGRPYAMRFGYGPAPGRTVVLITKRVSVLRPGQLGTDDGTLAPDALALVTWFD